MSSESPPVEIVAPDAAELEREALRRVFRHLPREDRAAQTQAAARGLAESPEANRLLITRRHGRIAAAALAQLQPGRTALVWPPTPRARPVAGDAERPVDEAAALLAAARDWTRLQGAVLAQVLLPSVDRRRREMLGAAGFRHLADLLYLGGTAEDFPPRPRASPLRLEPYAAAGHDRFARVVERTYEGTRDCPAMDGVRRIDDVLLGYRSAGVFRPEQWLLARHNDGDVGCLILMDHPDYGNLELVYMGVVPAWRGRGFGAALVDHALWCAGRLGRQRLVLAVDAKNEPALAVYTAAGLREWARRVVYVCRFDGK